MQQTFSPGVVVGWQPIYPPPTIPLLASLVTDLRKQINEAAKLPRNNYWKIAACWEHMEHELSYFYNLYDSFKHKWSVRIYKYNEGDCYKIKNVTKGFFDPETTQWKEAQHQEAQKNINELIHELNCENGERYCTSYLVVKAWVSGDQLAKKRRFFVNMVSNDGDEYYAKINVYSYKCKPELSYVDDGHKSYPPMIPN